MTRPKVVKLAQPGIDVKTAGDENLVYNSNWPLLKIYKQGSVSVTQFQTTSILATHDLGYVPAFWFFTNNRLDSWTNIATTIVDNRSEFLGPQTFFPGVTDKNLIYDVNPGFQSGTFKFYYYIFALDITKKYEAPVIKSGGVIGPRNKKTAFKLSKPGFDVSSPSMGDYVINTDARSPMIHAVIPLTATPDGSVNGYGVTYFHNLGYAPMFFAYVKTDALSGVANPTPNSYLLLWTASPVSGFTVDDKKISFTTSIAQQITLVILKDPFNVDYTIQVTV